MIELLRYKDGTRVDEGDVVDVAMPGGRVDRGRVRRADPTRGVQVWWPGRASEPLTWVAVDRLTFVDAAPERES